ncbi:MAG TPA: formate dehydrogenase accessory sulfurtransferase FdhD [Verrucomicrobiae bacterium]|jgi:FdhD protein|nr:formate dehydrogenase accessory sulfurtransferase FdhD [Verrucomicrobiae bacterium]
MGLHFAWIMHSESAKEIAVRRINGVSESNARDFLAAEEPLEIRVEGRSIAIVMRTPGEDSELAAGFLVTEGLVHTSGDIVDISCSNGNAASVRLRHPESMDLKKLTRHVFTSSSCGICSKASIDAVRQQFPRVENPCTVERGVLLGLPDALASAQETFKRTGGLHACALFDLTGRLLVLREDVGRHNALDKVVGWALLSNRLPLREHILLLSGRASFEMMQKALAAGVPIVAAISAPSSLAAEFAQESGQTLIGFLRGDTMNVYAGAGRVG